MNITPQFRPSITAHPDAVAIEGVISTVCADFSARFVAPVSITVAFGWNELGGQPMPKGDIGASSFALTGPLRWTGATGMLTYLKALAAKNPGSDYAAAVATLPATDPGNGQWNFPYPMGILYGWPLSPLNPHGYVAFSSAVLWSYSGAPPTGYYDLAGVVRHELSEVMGRASGCNQSPAYWLLPYDLYRFTAPGVRAGLAGPEASYFSLDNGVTNLRAFNAALNRDAEDWSTISGAPDANTAVVAKGKINPWLAVDDMALTALGWNVTTI